MQHPSHRGAGKTLEALGWLRALGWDSPEGGVHSGTPPAVSLDKPRSFSQSQLAHLQNGDLSTTTYLPDDYEYQML